MKAQYIIFCIIIAAGLWLLFFETFVAFGRLVNKRFSNMKKELERDENER